MVGGLIRLDHAPWWLLIGGLVELLDARLRFSRHFVSLSIPKQMVLY